MSVDAIEGSQEVDPARYDRQMYSIGAEGMSRLLHARILIMGLTPTGTEIARNLLLAGCSQLLLMDEGLVTHDDVENNFYLTAGDLGCVRGSILATRLAGCNSTATVVCVSSRECLHACKAPSMQHHGNVRDRRVAHSRMGAVDVVVGVNLRLTAATASDLSADVFDVWYSTARSENVCKFLDSIPAETKFIEVGCCNVVGAFRSDFGRQFLVTNPHGVDSTGSAVLLRSLSIVSPSSDDSSIVCYRIDLGSLTREEEQTLSPPWWVSLATASSSSDSSNAHASSRRMFEIKCVASHSGASGLPRSTSSHEIDIIVPTAVDELWITELVGVGEPVFVTGLQKEMVLTFNGLTCATASWGRALGNSPTTACNMFSPDDSVCRLLDVVELSVKEARSVDVEVISDIIASSLRDTISKDDDVQLQRLFQTVATCWDATFFPVASLVASIASHEVMKAITGVGVPYCSNSPWVFDCRWLLPSVRTTAPRRLSEEDASPVSSAERTLGTDAFETIQNARVFLVGAGAIGCEYLKHFATLGFGCGRKGLVEVTDPDHIEISNLSRQFLFSAADVTKSKSGTAVAAVRRKRKQMKCRSYVQSLSSETTGQSLGFVSGVGAAETDWFGSSFLSKIDLLCSAVDNDTAREILDELSFKFGIPLVDSGTQGPQGHVVTIVPHLTGRLSDASSSLGGGGDHAALPFCTLRFFPTKFEHCVEWGLHLFAVLFEQPFTRLTEADRMWLGGKDAGGVVIERQELQALHERFTNEIVLTEVAMDAFNGIVGWGGALFARHFEDTVATLLHEKPLFNSDMTPNSFWNDKSRIPPRHPPSECRAQFLVAVSPLLLEKVKDVLPCDTFLDIVVDVALLHNAEGKRAAERIATACSLLDDVLSTLAVATPAESCATRDVGAEYRAKIDCFLSHHYDGAVSRRCRAVDPNAAPEGPPPQAKRLSFEKDCAAHVLLVSTAANIRAICYRIPPRSTMDVKRIAGRIVPALITTTSAVTSFAVMQAIVLLSMRSLGDNVREKVEYLPSDESNASKTTLLRSSLRDVNFALQNLENSFAMEVSLVKRRRLIVSAGGSPRTHPECSKVLCFTSWTLWTITVDEDVTFELLCQICKDKYLPSGARVVRLVESITSQVVFDEAFDAHRCEQNVLQYVVAMWRHVARVSFQQTAAAAANDERCQKPDLKKIRTAVREVTFAISVEFPKSDTSSAEADNNATPLPSEALTTSAAVSLPPLRYVVAAPSRKSAAAKQEPS